MNNTKQNLRDKYNQLRIQQKSLDKQISDLEKKPEDKKNPGKNTRKLSELYRARVKLRDEISEVASQL